MIFDIENNIITTIITFTTFVRLSNFFFEKTMYAVIAKNNTTNMMRIN